MKNILVFSLLTSILVSCIDAANNSRNKDDGKNVRDTRAGSGDKLAGVKSQFFRNVGKDQLTTNQMIAKIKEDNLVDYRLIPNPDSDHDLMVGLQMQNLENCGMLLTADSIKDRINHCIEKNGDNSTWDGSVQGNSGEGRWQLVYFDKNEDDSSPSREAIWQDESTGLLWSHGLGKANWETASGSDVAKEDFICNQIETLPADEVKWALPTRNVFLQADLNGARFVLPDTAEYYWTATKNNRTQQAWAIEQSTGKLTSLDEMSQRKVRCVGFPIK
ncbi:MAG: hypothetical protein CME62_15220 [Halobacteriovoraceae bacterium]|nr:hypothetical protein [Halobacteriovoraceae bacterium]